MPQNTVRRKLNQFATRHAPTPTHMVVEPARTTRYWTIEVCVAVQSFCIGLAQHPHKHHRIVEPSMCFDYDTVPKQTRKPRPLSPYVRSPLKRHRLAIQG